MNDVGLVFRVRGISWRALIRRVEKRIKNAASVLISKEPKSTPPSYWFDCVESFASTHQDATVGDWVRFCKTSIGMAYRAGCSDEAMRIRLKNDEQPKWISDGYVWDPNAVVQTELPETESNVLFYRED
jgi:hypothetical protein